MHPRNVYILKLFYDYTTRPVFFWRALISSSFYFHYMPSQYFCLYHLALMWKVHLVIQLAVLPGSRPSWKKCSIERRLWKSLNYPLMVFFLLYFCWVEIRARVANLWPLGQIQPTEPYCVTHRAARRAGEFQDVAYCLNWGHGVQLGICVGRGQRAAALLTPARFCHSLNCHICIQPMRSRVDSIWPWGSGWVLHRWIREYLQL